jgi:acyl carrier protein
MLTRADIIEKITKYLTEDFEIPEKDFSLEARLYEDLDLDSIDAIDLVLKLQELSGKKISPDDFRTVRTVGDVVDKVYVLVSEKK